jgi:hypothetical protein
VKHLRRYALMFASAFVLLFCMQAQQTPAATGGTVTGTVTCSDSGAPARFAKVLLKSTQPDHAGQDFMKNMQDNIQKMVAKSGQSAEPVKPLTDEKKKAMASATKNINQALEMMKASTVGLDGKFSFAGVKPGTYYVHAIYPGYIDPVSQLSDEDLVSTDPAIRARLAQIPTITVSGSDSAQVDLHLARGASVSGRILYDDGSPASGWIVSVVDPKAPNDGSDAVNATMAQALAMSGAAPLFKADDLGHYRVSGLAAGNYLVSATLTATPTHVNASNIADAGGIINLDVYSGDTFSRPVAKSITISAGEEHANVDITIPARSLHTIVGHIYAKSDNHALNMGQVSLSSKENPALHRTAAIRADGSFHFEYLPAGLTYTITADNAEDGKIGPCDCKFMGIGIPDQEVLHKFETASTDVKLGATDIETVRLTVAQTDWTPPVKKPGGPDMKSSDLLNGILGAMSDAPDKSNTAPKP